MTEEEKMNGVMKTIKMSYRKKSVRRTAAILTESN
jgi:hypothetical protein